jgi:hypothetical protein
MGDGRWELGDGSWELEECGECGEREMGMREKGRLRSLFPIPYSLFPIHYPLFPIPYSLAIPVSNSPWAKYEIDRRGVGI